MTPAARLSAAIEVFAEIEARRRPAADALKDWGLAHRFAGSSDRAAIAGLVYDALRRKASAAWLIGEATPRAVLIGMLHRERGYDVAQIAALCSGRFAPGPLTEAERAALERGSLAGAPPPVEGDYPEWLDPHFARVFGEERVAEGGALASRAPLDMRVNTLKGVREEVVPRLEHLHAAPRAGRRSACASGSRPIRRARRSTPSRPSARARSKSRTKARSSPPFSRAHAPANRSSISRPAPAARRWP